MAARPRVTALGLADSVLGGRGVDLVAGEDHAPALLVRGSIFRCTYRP
jgi:hypothetical protein